MYSRPYHPNDWNHGERSLVAIDETDNEILISSKQMVMPIIEINYKIGIYSIVWL
jgi:hypothetical protein